MFRRREISRKRPLKTNVKGTVPSKPKYFYNQSAVVPVRYTKNRLEVLLIRNQSGRRWIVPKGIIEPGLKASESAAKEALEEAGVVGKLGARLGRYTYRKWGGECIVKVFLLYVEEIHKEWEESYRERAWYSLQAAAKRIGPGELRNIILSIPEVVGENAKKRRTDRERI